MHSVSCANYYDVSASDLARFVIWAFDGNRKAAAGYLGISESLLEGWLNKRYCTENGAKIGHYKAAAHLPGYRERMGL